MVMVMHTLHRTSLISHSPRALFISQRLKHWSRAFFKVDESADKHGGDLVAKTLKSHGVKEIFTLCGGHITPILVGCESLGIRVVDTRHEVTTVFAADAVARLRQDIGVAAVTSGPGVTNTITAVKNAQMAESALLLLGGAAPTTMQHRGALQDIDQLSIFKPVCKHTARVTRVQDIIPKLKESIQIAKSGTPGPVFVEIPIDLLYPYEQAFRDAIINKPANTTQMLYNQYINLKINYEFHNGFNNQDTTPLSVSIPQAKGENLSKVSELLKNAKKPLLLLGSQATLSPITAQELQKIVNDLGIPCYLGGMCRGLLGLGSPIQLRQNRRGALKEADLVILAGTPADFRLDYGKILSPSSKVVALNRSADNLKKNHGIYWNSEALLQADVASTLKELRNRLTNHLAQKKNDWSEWLKILKDVEEKVEAKNAHKADEPGVGEGVNPLKLLKEFDKVLPDDAILIADGGDFVATSSYILRPRGPLQWLDPGQFGTLGVGGGFALGAKTVFPNKPVFIIYGDGSTGYSLMEFDSFARQNLPVTALVGNDACWTQIARAQVPQFKTDVACGLKLTHYEDTVKSLGAEGFFIDKSNEKDIAEIAKKAIETQRNGKPSLVNVHISKTDFRDNSISV